MGTGTKHKRLHRGETRVVGERNVIRSLKQPIRSETVRLMQTRSHYVIRRKEIGARIMNCCACKESCFLLLIDKERFKRTEPQCAHKKCSKCLKMILSCDLPHFTTNVPQVKEKKMGILLINEK